MASILDTSTHLLYDNTRFSLTTNSGEPSDLSLLYTVERSSSDGDTSVYIPTSNTRTVKVMVTPIQESFSTYGERSRVTPPLAFFRPEESTLYIVNRAGSPKQGLFNYVISVVGETPTSSTSIGLYVSSPTGALEVDQDYRSYNLYERREIYQKVVGATAPRPRYSTGIPSMKYPVNSATLVRFTPTLYAPLVVCQCQNYFSVEALIRVDGKFVGVSVYSPYGFEYMAISIYTSEVPDYSCGYKVSYTDGAYLISRVRDSSTTSGAVVRNEDNKVVYNSTLIPLRIVREFDVPFSGAVLNITGIPSTSVNTARADLPKDVVTTSEYGVLNSSSSYLHAYRGSRKYRSKCIAKHWFGGCTAKRHYYYHTLSYSKSLVAIVGSNPTGIGTTYGWDSWTSSTRTDSNFGIRFGSIDLLGGRRTNDSATRAANSTQATTLALINNLGFPIPGNSGVNDYAVPKGYVCALSLPSNWRTLGTLGPATPSTTGFVPTLVPGATTVDMESNALVLANIHFITTTMTPIVFAMASSTQTFYTDNPTYAPLFLETPVGGTYLYQYKSSMVQPPLGRVATFIDPTEEVSEDRVTLTVSSTPTASGYEWIVKENTTVVTSLVLGASDKLPLSLTSSYMQEQQCYSNIIKLLPSYYDDYETRVGLIGLPEEARTSIEYFDKLPGTLCLYLLADALTITSAATFNDDPNMYVNDVYGGETLTSVLTGSIVNSPQLVSNTMNVTVNLCFDSFYSAAKYYAGPLTSSLTYDHRVTSSVEYFSTLLPEGANTTFHTGPGYEGMFDTTVVTTQYSSDPNGPKDSSAVTTFTRLRDTRFGTFGVGTVFPKFTNMVYVNKVEGYWYELTFEETLSLFTTYGDNAVSPTYQALRDDINSALQSIVDTGDYLVLDGGHPFSENIIRDPNVPGVSIVTLDLEGNSVQQTIEECTYTSEDTGTVDTPTTTITIVPLDGSSAIVLVYPTESVVSVATVYSILPKSPSNTHGVVEVLGRNLQGDSPYTFDFSTASSKHPEYFISGEVDSLTLNTREPSVVDNKHLFTYIT